MKRFVLFSVVCSAAFSAQVLACGMSEHEAASNGDGCDVTTFGASLSQPVCEQTNFPAMTFSEAALYGECEQTGLENNASDKSAVETEKVCRAGDNAMFSALKDAYAVCESGAQTTAGG